MAERGWESAGSVSCFLRGGKNKHPYVRAGVPTAPRLVVEVQLAMLCVSAVGLKACGAAALLGVAFPFVGKPYEPTCFQP